MCACCRGFHWYVLQATTQMVFNASFATAAASMSDMTLVALAPGVNATSVAAAGANTSSLLRAPPTTATVGSRVYVVVTLRTAAGRPVMQAGGVQVNVTGELQYMCARGGHMGEVDPGDAAPYCLPCWVVWTCVCVCTWCLALFAASQQQDASLQQPVLARHEGQALNQVCRLFGGNAGTASGQLALPPLSRTTDGLWATWFTPTGAETLTAFAAVGGQVVRTLQLQALGSGAGVNPFYLNYPASAAAATLVSQNMASTSPVASGSALLVYTNESSLLSAPVLDVGGKG
jgi:hypothetical protein